MTDKDHKVWEKIGSLDFVCYCKFKLLQIKKNRAIAGLIMDAIDELYEDYKKKKGYK